MHCFECFYELVFVVVLTVLFLPKIRMFLTILLKGVGGTTHTHPYASPSLVSAAHCY